jgi:hypothetical protein
MSAALTPDELALFVNIPEGDLVELAADLDLAIPAVIDRRTLLEQAVVAMAQLGRTKGLPLSPYDRDDLEALPPEHLRALCALCGTAANVDALLKSGRKSYKAYKDSPMAPIPMMLPMLLPAIARYAHQTG